MEEGQQRFLYKRWVHGKPPPPLSLYLAYEYVCGYNQNLSGTETLVIDGPVVTLLDIYDVITLSLETTKSKEPI